MDKKWKLIIGIEAYYLTDSQKDFYLDAVNKGVKYVALDEKRYLGTQFQTLVHLDVIDESKKMDTGKWQCSYGKWHEKGWDCNCGKKLVFDEVTKTYKEIEIKEIEKV